LLLSIKKRGSFLLEERANGDQQTKVKINETDVTMNHFTETTSSLEILIPD
jgi:hypothetical protein